MSSSKKRAYDSDDNDHHYESMTVAQLKQTLIQRGIHITAKKDELIKVLERDDALAVFTAGGGGTASAAAAAAKKPKTVNSGGAGAAAAGGGSSSSADADADADADESWRKTIECCICFDMMLPPIMQCQNGHGVCQACCKRIDKCPQCQVSMATPTRCRILENVLSDKKVQCRVCRELVTMGTVEEHEKAHTPLFCKYGAGCTFNTRTTSTLVQHLVEEHDMIVDEPEKEGRSYFPIAFDIDNERAEFPQNRLCKYENQHFHIRIDVYLHPSILRVCTWSLESGETLNNAMHCSISRLEVYYSQLMNEKGVVCLSKNLMNTKHVCEFELKSTAASELNEDGSDKSIGRLLCDREKWLKMTRDEDGKWKFMVAILRFGK